MESSYAIIRKRLANQPKLAAGMERMVAVGKLQVIDADTPLDGPLPSGELMIVLCGFTATPGAEIGTCGCGASVWVSEKMQAAIADYTGPHQLICLRCMAAVVERVVAA